MQIKIHIAVVQTLNSKHDDGRQPITTGHPSYSGDLKSWIYSEIFIMTAKETSYTDLYVTF